MSDSPAPKPAASAAAAKKQKPAMILEEARALAFYIARHGDVLTPPQDGAAETAAERSQLYDELLAAVSAAEVDGSPESWRRLMAAYAKVSALTYKERGINGRSILDTMGASAVDAPRAPFLQRCFSAQASLILWSLFLFGLILFLEFITGQTAPPEWSSGWYKKIYTVFSQLSSLLTPAAWGGLGACVFLMKRQTARLAGQSYEKSRVRGEPTRLFLGASLGVIIVVLFPEVEQAGEYSRQVTAFVAGLGVKPVYAAFEELSEGLSKRISGKGGGK